MVVDFFKKNRFLYLLVIICILLACCVEKELHYSYIFVGNWFYCDDGYYTELHVSTDYIEYCPEVDPVGILYKYEIVQDSLYAINVNNENQKIIGKLDVLADNHILLTYFDKNTQRYDTLFLSRLFDTIEFILDSLKLEAGSYLKIEENYLINYRQRSLLNLCNTKDKFSLGDADLLDIQGVQDSISSSTESNKDEVKRKN